MKLDVPAIYWHGNSERIMSIDVLRGDPLVLVTAGADTHESCYIRVWNWAGGQVTHTEDLTGTHERAVNVVRFSHCGRWLASGGDDGVVVLWEKKLKQTFGDEEPVLGWTASKILRGHTGEVHDLSWKEDSTALVSASVDGNAIVFDIIKGKLVHRLQCQGKVMGVAWSPVHIATQSSDRTLRLWKLGGVRYFVAHSIKDHNGQRLFQPDLHAHAFFRRLSFTPDGSLLVTAGGQWEERAVAHCYVNKHWDAPAFTLPVPDSTVVACRACPIPFESSSASSLLTGCGVKWVWAVATRTTVLVYDSEHTHPLSAVSNAHYSSLTDLVWCSPTLLAISSNDGFVSFLIFEETELGKPIKTEVSRVAEVEAERPVIEVREQKNAEGKRRFVPVLITS